MRQYFGTSAPVFVRASGQRTKRQDTTQFTVAPGVPPKSDKVLPDIEQWCDKHRVHRAEACKDAWSSEVCHHRLVRQAQDPDCRAGVDDAGVPQPKEKNRLTRIGHSAATHQPAYVSNNIRRTNRAGVSGFVGKSGKFRMRLVDPLGECWTAEIGPILRQNCDNFMFFPIGINAVKGLYRKKMIRAAYTRLWENFARVPESP